MCFFAKNEAISTIQDKFDRRKLLIGLHAVCVVSRATQNITILNIIINIKCYLH